MQRVSASSVTNVPGQICSKISSFRTTSAKTRVNGIAIGVRHAQAFAIEDWQMKHRMELL